MQMRSLMIEHGMGDVFYHHIERCINEGFVRSVPGDALLSMYQHWKLQPDLLVRLLEQLDVRTIDQNIAIHICEKLGLKELLIHICNENQDYITPIMKLLPIEMDDASTKDPLTIQILDYIERLLHGERINGQKLEDGVEYWEMVKSLVNYMYIEDHIKMLMQV